MIVFETHSTSLHNEAGVASGRLDVDLSPRGEREAAELGTRYRDGGVDIVHASDLRRSWRTAEIAFGRRGIEVVRDARLSECDYGELTGRPVGEIDAHRLQAVRAPFPGGESYAEVTARVARWLDDVRARAACRVLVIGHRGTHYALEHLLAGVPLEQAVQTPLRWRPGWRYDVPERDDVRRMR